MRVAKEFRFEAAHRIPWHEGDCRHLHGHSYHVTVALDGEPDERGMVIDFRHIKALLKDLIGSLDHSTMASADDHELIAAVEGLGSKLCILPYHSTAENICRFIGERLVEQAAGVLFEHGIAAVHVQVRETATCYAETTVTVRVPAGNGVASA
jgi:6-pyruvoyltetrahydropterin/6-carboxytetrahydropterin synthase